MKKIFAVVMFWMAAGCTSSNSTKETAEKYGFSDVDVTSLAPMSCDENDFMGRHFKAKNQAGKDVDGVVCCNFFTCSVRL